MNHNLLFSIFFNKIKNRYLYYDKEHRYLVEAPAHLPHKSAYYSYCRTAQDLVLHTAPLQSDEKNFTICVLNDLIDRVAIVKIRMKKFITAKLKKSMIRQTETIIE